MPIEPNELIYKKLYKAWPPGPCLRVSFSSIDLILQLPLEFVRLGGYNTLRFVQWWAAHLVKEDGVLRKQDGLDEELDLSEAPQAVDYTFVPEFTDVVFTETVGPQGKNRRASPMSSDGESSVSHSSRNSEDDNDFHLQVAVRDGEDYFLGTRATECVSAHLVPQSRPDLYVSLTGEYFAHDVSYGLLMDPTLHKAYDRYQFSLFYMEDRYYFHAFDASVASFKKLHGLSFGKDRMRSYAPPDPNLCNWHYQQCVLKFGRGYSVAMAVNAL
ncbi:hypothetical protein JCM11251_000790 [Rhodosporidiobolus azoricus]